MTKHPTAAPAPVQFYNTLVRHKEIFRSLAGRQARIYTCGPTVYNFAHIGNFRAYTFEDILCRTLRYAGYEVQQVMNLTDVDDKTIRGSRQAGVPLKAFTQPFVDAFFADLRTLNIEPAAVYPAATDHVPEMIALIQRLFANGLAYHSEDGSVYFVEYGDFGATPAGAKDPRPGRVRVIRADGRSETIAEGIWRARGLARHPAGLIVVSEADREDHGNSGQLLLIESSSRRLTPLLTGLDYPQFPQVAADGEIYFTLARDGWLARYSLTRRHPRERPAVAADFELGVVGGRRHEPQLGAPTLRVSLPAIHQEFAVVADVGARRLSGWAYFPASLFPLRREEYGPARDVAHPGPGFFEVPACSAQSLDGRCRAVAIAVRSQLGCRWPMTHVGTAQESPAPGFSETPQGYLIYFDWDRTSPAATDR